MGGDGAILPGPLVAASDSDHHQGADTSGGDEMRHFWTDLWTGIAAGLLGLGLVPGGLGPAVARAGDGAIEINQARALAGGVTATDTAGFPVTLDTTASYVLTGNLVPDSGATAAISIEAPEVELDLAGFSISGGADCQGTPPSLTCPVPSDTDGIVSTGAASSALVRGGSLARLRLGVRLLGDTSRVEDLRVRRCSGSGIVLSAPGGTVQHNSVSLNRGEGIDVTLDARVLHNSVIANGGTGINTSFNATVSDNTVTTSGVGIVAGQGSSVARNTVSDNVGLGLDLSTGAGYVGNVADGNNGGNANTQVQGGVQLGANLCAANLCN